MTSRRFFSSPHAGIALLIALTVTACGGGGGSAPSPAAPPVPTAHVVNLSWAANREAAVNSAGGGYKVAITGQPVIDVPAASGTAATTTLMSGTYSVTVTAYSAMNPTTGIAASGVVSSSLPSAAYTITVPY